MKKHSYEVSVTWTGNQGTGTSAYRAYGRDHLVHAPGKPDIEGSSDRIFHGDVERWNPEELLIAALSQCHMLSFLHVACDAGVVVTAYRDHAEGVLELRGDGGGAVTSVTLKPEVDVVAGHGVDIHALHERAHELCFIANSVNFPVEHLSTVRDVASL